MIWVREFFFDTERCLTEAYGKSPTTIRRRGCSNLLIKNKVTAMKTNNTFQSPKSKLIGLSTLLALSMQGAVSAATLAFVPNIPTTDVLVSRGNEAGAGTGASQATFGFRNADAAGTEGSRGRGQSLLFSSLVAGSSFDISSLAVAMNNGADDAGFRPTGQLQLTVFEWDNADPDDFGPTVTAGDVGTWDTNTGATGGTEIFSGSFAVASGSNATVGTIAGNLAQIDFTAGELTLDVGTAYGFFFLYTLDSFLDAGGNPLNEDVTIAFDADNNAADGGAGALLNTNVGASFGVADNGQSTTRDMNYFITGTEVIPEPSSALLSGVGLLALLRRRR